MRRKLVGKIVLFIVAIISLIGCNNDRPSPVCVDTACGYLTKKLEWAITPQFDAVNPFDKNGRAWVQQDDKIGLINLSGEWIIPPQFDETKYFTDNGLACVKQNDKYGYVDKTGKFVIELQFDGALSFDDNVLALIEQNDKYGYIDKTGKFVIEPRFDDMFFFDNGLAEVKQDGKYGYIDKTGKIVIEPQFDNADSFADNGLAYVKQSGKYGFIDKTGQFVFELPYDFVASFASNGLAVFKEKNGKYGYIDKTGQYAIKPQFEDAYSFTDNGLAQVEQNGKSFYIDKTGTIIPILSDLVAYGSRRLYMRYNGVYNMLYRRDIQQGERHLVNSKGKTVAYMDSICDVSVLVDTKENVLWPQKTADQICEEKRDAERKRIQANIQSCSDVYIGQSFSRPVKSFWNDTEFYVVMRIVPEEGYVVARIKYGNNDNSYTFNCSDVY
jgi:hypothetical protein